MRKPAPTPRFCGKTYPSQRVRGGGDTFYNGLAASFYSTGVCSRFKCVLTNFNMIADALQTFF